MELVVMSVAGTAAVEALEANIDTVRVILAPGCQYSG
jgi:hypothetical protein